MRKTLIFTLVVAFSIFLVSHVHAGYEQVLGADNSWTLDVTGIENTINAPDIDAVLDCTHTFKAVGLDNTTHFFSFCNKYFDSLTLFIYTPITDWVVQTYTLYDEQFGDPPNPTPTPTPTPSGTPTLLSDIASNSLDILPVYASMTAGDLLIILCLFILIMLQLLWIFWRKI
jgi:hypothetical protein